MADAMTRTYFVYILTNRSGTLYVGMTNDIDRRLAEHRRAGAGRFAGRYRMTRLAYVETTDDVRAALAREKQLKGWRRRRKLDLIHTTNPKWLDLSAARGLTIR